MTDFKDLRIGMVGLGTIGRIHARGLTELGATVVGADLDATAREAFTEEYGAATYEDHSAMLRDGVDGVIVGVPNRVHEEVAVDALEAGVDVLLEKPVAHDLDSAERIAAAARDADAFCMVGFTIRYAGQTRAVVERRRRGDLGDISHVDVNYLRRGGVPGRGWFTDPGLSGGGVLVDLGVHAIDLALHVMDYPEVVEVSGQTRSEFGEYGVEDSATALIRCADGATVSVDVSWHGTCSPSRACTIRGDRGGVEFVIGAEEMTVFDADLDTVLNTQPDAEPETVSVEQGAMHREENRAFLEGVAGRRDDLGESLTEGLVVQRILDAIYESSEVGTAVRIEG